MKSTFLVLLFTLLTPILSWWDVGHMLTAAIAQIRLNQLDVFSSVQIRQLVMSINNLCDNKSQTFIESSSWADDIKSNEYSMRIWDVWHFKDGAYVEDGLIPTINYTTISVNSVATVQQAIKALKVNLLKSTAERALFARYLVHMVGDIHQPLHSAALYNQTYKSGDQGGNFLKIKLSNGNLMNFHSFWDSGANLIQNQSWQLPRPLNDQNLSVLKKRANSLIDEYGKQVQELAKDINPSTWAKQSFKISVNTTYPHMQQSNEATPQYIALAYQTCKKRITLAGYRLANVIMDIYKTKEQDSPKLLATSNDKVNKKQQIIQNLKDIWDDFQKDALRIRKQIQTQ